MIIHVINFDINMGVINFMMQLSESGGPLVGWVIVDNSSFSVPEGILHIFVQLC